MDSRISKKVIFSSFLFINLIQPSKAADFYKIKTNENNQVSRLSWSYSPNKKKPINFSKIFFNSSTVTTNAEKKFLRKNSNPKSVAFTENKNGLIIQSDKQSVINDVIYAEGNVSVSYKGKLL